jgi:hypothetical protein
MARDSQMMCAIGRAKPKKSTKYTNRRLELSVERVAQAVLDPESVAAKRGPTFNVQLIVDIVNANPPIQKYDHWIPKRANRPLADRPVSSSLISHISSVAKSVIKIPSKIQ